MNDLRTSHYVGEGTLLRRWLVGLDLLLWMVSEPERWVPTDLVKQLFHAAYRSSRVGVRVQRTQ